MTRQLIHILAMASALVLCNSVACSPIPPQISHSDVFLTTCAKYDSDHNWACTVLVNMDINSGAIMLPSNKSIEPLLKRKNLSLKSSIWTHGQGTCNNMLVLKPYASRFAQAHYGGHAKTYKGKTLRPFTSNNLELTKAYNKLKKLGVTVYFIDEPFPF